MESHHVADDSYKVPAGEGVVADISDTGFGQQLIAQPNDSLLNFGIYPGEHAVTNDVIKGSNAAVKIHDGRMPQIDVWQVERLYLLLPIQDLYL